MFLLFFRKSIYNIYLQRLTFILGLDINYVWVVFCIKLMINNDSNNITKWDRKSGDEVEGNLGDAGSTFTFHKKKKIKNTVTLPQIPITGYMVILRIIHATFTFAHIPDMQHIALCAHYTTQWETETGDGPPQQQQQQTDQNTGKADMDSLENRIF